MVWKPATATAISARRSIPMSRRRCARGAGAGTRSRCIPPVRCHSTEAAVLAHRCRRPPAVRRLLRHRSRRQAQAGSYRAIADALGALPKDVLFLSDVVAELDAARRPACARLLLDRREDYPEPRTGDATSTGMRGSKIRCASNRTPDRPPPAPDPMRIRIGRPRLAGPVRGARQCASTTCSPMRRISRRRRANGSSIPPTSTKTNPVERRARRCTRMISVGADPRPVRHRLLEQVVDELYARIAQLHTNLRVRTGAGAVGHQSVGRMARWQNPA